LLHHDKHNGYVMTHAGLAPSWTVHEAKLLAQEVENVLRSNAPEFFLQNMYGNQPNKWSDQLSGIERLRCIVNYFTRMRFCYADGSLDLAYKGEIAGKPDDLIPWFDVKDRANANDKIIFGHWAALNGKADVPNIFPLDTGCVWGNCLTAMRLEDGIRFSVKC
jgi:bis(5'-nucleosyl)-tetraphosphatase (symmetrical)